VLTLNPDVLVEPGFLRALVEAGETDPGTGTVCGKLRAIGPGFVPLDSPRIDSTGIYFTPALRHFDRGWHEPDLDSYNQPEYVFGATAAAALYRRRMIEDVSIDGAFFDPDFFVYREDADVAWRAQLLGWRCLYTPGALAYHVRTLNPWNRRSVPAALNMHSVKNDPARRRGGGRLPSLGAHFAGGFLAPAALPAPHPGPKKDHHGPPPRGRPRPGAMVSVAARRVPRRPGRRPRRTLGFRSPRRDPRP
jgi:hypothetical protein